MKGYLLWSILLLDLISSYNMNWYIENIIADELFSFQLITIKLYVLKFGMGVDICF